MYVLYGVETIHVYCIQVFHHILFFETDVLISLKAWPAFESWGANMILIIFGNWGRKFAKKL